MSVLIFYPLSTMTGALVALALFLSLAIDRRLPMIALAVLILLPGAPIFVLRCIAHHIVLLCDLAAANIRWPSPMLAAAHYLERLGETE